MRFSAGLAAAQWLSLRLQLLAASIVVFVAGLGVAGAENALPSFASHMQGFALIPLRTASSCTGGWHRDAEACQLDRGFQDYLV